jgi:hypothetical protein
LIELITVKKQACIDEAYLSDLEKILRLNKELDINFEGIDAIFHLLKRVEELQEELKVAKVRLSLYEQGGTVSGLVKVAIFTINVDAEN